MTPIPKIPESGAAAELGTVRVRRWALRVLASSILAIAVAYGSAFLSPTVAALGPWLLAAFAPLAMFALMLLGAAPRRGSAQALLWPFLVVYLLVAGGLLLALRLPPDAATTSLWLGLPPRAAVILFGVGLLPLFLLPIVYAMTFDSLTLTASDVERVRAARRVLDAGQPASERGA